MPTFNETLSRSALISFLVLGAMPAATFAGDLSKYRDFQLGTGLSTVAKQAGTDPTQVKVIQRRPALIQAIEWHPQSLGSSPGTEPAKEMVLSFYDGELFRIVISYDRYATEGLTADDMAESISAMYGIAVKPTAPSMAATGRFGDQEEILAQWQDSQYRFDLIRSSYGPSFKLVGVLKRLEALAQASIIEAARLDDKEAPLREAERTAREDEKERVKLVNARQLNKPRFRP
jgi:hypothetical protein